MTNPGFQACFAAGRLPPGAVGAALGVALATVGRLDDLPALFRAARDAQAPVEVLREGVLSAHLFCGFPRAIEAFRALDEAFGGLPPASDEESEGPFNGEPLFERIYAEQAHPVRGILRGFHPAFERAVLEDAYGRILSRSPLDARTREIIAVCALTAARLPLQLESHVRGALRLGAPVADVAAAIELGGVAGGRDAEASARALLTRLERSGDA